MLFSALVVAALAVTACARITGGRGGGGIDYPRGPEDLVLQVHSGGGFVPIVWHLREIPLFSLYGDGRVITQGPQIAIYPPPALPSLVERHVSEEGVLAILRAARDAGLRGEDRRLEVFEVTDLPTTTFTVVTDGQTHQTAVYGLGEVPEDIPVGDREARQTLLEFQAKLMDLESWLPEGSVSSDRPYEFDRLRIFVIPAPELEGGGGDDELQPSKMDWPLAEELSGFGQPMKNTPDIRCGAVEGADLTAVVSAAAGANLETRWRSGGDVHQLALVPLLPGEPACPEQ